MLVRPLAPSDAEALGAVLEPVIRAGDAYAVPPDLGRDGALAYWCEPGHEVFVAEEGGELLGSYYLRANQAGGGAHVANAGYVTRQAARGRGVARAMCAHSLDRARARGFRAMQFNFVVATNERAVRLWQSFDFAVVGRLPEAFAHPTLGLVDALVMYRRL
jgi:L-amino acid N-acyltransferase YncA